MKKLISTWWWRLSIDSRILIWTGITTVLMMAVLILFAILIK